MAPNKKSKDRKTYYIKSMTYSSVYPLLCPHQMRSFFIRGGNIPLRILSGTYLEGGYIPPPPCLKQSRVYALYAPTLE